MAFVVLRTRGPTRPPKRSSPGPATQMANYKVPRRVEILDELPVNATGKVEKLVLRELAARG